MGVKCSPSESLASKASTRRSSDKGRFPCMSTHLPHSIRHAPKICHRTLAFSARGLYVDPCLSSWFFFCAPRNKGYGSRLKAALLGIAAIERPNIPKNPRLDTLHHLKKHDGHSYQYSLPQTTFTAYFYP